MSFKSVLSLDYSNCKLIKFLECRICRVCDANHYPWPIWFASQSLGQPYEEMNRPPERESLAAD